MGVKFGLLP